MNLETVKSQTQFFPPDVEEESLNPVWFPFVEVRKPCSSLIHIANVLQELVSNSRELQTGFHGRLLQQDLLRAQMDICFPQRIMERHGTKRLRKNTTTPILHLSTAYSHIFQHSAHKFNVSLCSSISSVSHLSLCCMCLQSPGN